MRHGGKILADHLKAYGVETVFSVPGESFLAALDGLHDSGIRNIVCRQEGGAAMMAEAAGKLTGKPGIAFVTRGPGATNASPGLHIAMQDSTPMILFVGQIDRGHRDREAFQEVDYRAFFGPLVKWVTEVDQTERLPEYLSRAFSVAMSGRPGPVVLALPEDMLSAQADVPDLIAPMERVTPDLNGSAERIAEALSGAENPLLIVGGSQWSPEAARDLEAFASAWQLPVAASFRRQDRVDNRHPCYVGDLNVVSSPALAERVRQADLLIALGTRLGDISTGGYTMLDPARPPKLIHIHPDADELGRVWRPAMAVQARPDDMIAALAKLPARAGWPAQVQAGHAAYEAWRQPQQSPGAVTMERVLSHLDAALPEDAIVTNGAGNYAGWVHRMYRWKQHGTQLAPTSGSMGYGLPAAIAASVLRPDQDVICMAGDGCLQMSINELSTAIQHGAKPIVIVVNNGRYGTIRMHQERSYPGRVSGTMLANPDFAALATAYGGVGFLVENDDDFPAALAEARASGKMALIELRVDEDALAPGLTLSGLAG
ncbi:MAG: thiamine pyrophosphate-binding protein [Rhodobacterales bacterium]|nr:MAG: thiamine pyrophosphate-binding protein [Rhodobacterales bacterium]